MTITPRSPSSFSALLACTGVGLVLLVGSVSAVGAQPRETAPSLIDAATLQQRLGADALVLLHVGPGDASSPHIAGAHHVALASLSTPRGEGRLTLELPDAATLQAQVRAWGITDASTIVVYAATTDNWTQATRVVFTLDSVGLGGQTRLLDGGLPAWTAAGYPTVTSSATPAVAASGHDGATPTPRRSVASFDEVRSVVTSRGNATQRSAVIIDARTADFYSGENDRRGAIPRPGHVPGAVNLPFADFFTRARPGDDASPLMLKPRAELERMFAQAGILPGTPVITYCHIGQQATVPYVVARLLGYDVRLYDGSFEEWSATESVAVEK